MTKTVKQLGKKWSVSNLFPSNGSYTDDTINRYPQEPLPMNQRTLIALAAGVTALILVVIALVMPRLSSPATVPAPTVAAAPPTNTATGAQSPAVPTAYAVSADQAGTLALTSAAGATLAGTPVLVTYQGVVAYEVPLSTGLAYVDATSGQVIMAPVAPDATAGSGATTGGGAEGQEDGEEEDDDD
jgi:hypothetical protein